MLKKIRHAAYKIYKFAGDIWDEDTRRFKLFRWFMQPAEAGNWVCVAARGFFLGGVALSIRHGAWLEAIAFGLPLTGLLLIEGLGWDKDPDAKSKGQPVDQPCGDFR